MFYELREYPIKKGCMDQWVKLMNEKILPFQKKMGMVIISSYKTISDEGETYIWIRKFENETQKQELYDKVYGSDEWQNSIRVHIKDMLIRDKMVVRILNEV